MTGFTRLVRLATTIVISVALGACGGSAKSPVAPSSSAAPAPSVTPGPPPTSSGTGSATIDGTVVGLAGAQRLGMRALAAGPSVTVAGTNVSSAIDPSGHFSLQGVPTGDVELEVSGNGATAMLPVPGVTEHERIHLTIQVNGTAATTDDSDRETTDNRAEVEGRITAINGTTLTVAGKLITVPTGIPIHHGATPIAFADLKPGMRIHVHGTNSGGGVIATDIEVQTDNPVSNQTELEGIVAALAGTCPAVTFKIGATVVVTDANTQFRNFTCSTLANGNKVEVKGTIQTNGTVLATSMEKSGDDNNNQQQEVNGVVSALGGSCPAITFTVGTTAVIANSSTQFKDATCASIANGDKVEVKGTKQTNGTLLASSIEKTGSDDHNAAGTQEVSGTVASLGGSCPSRTFTVGTTAVATNASTQFKDTTCATLANGDKVEVKGTKQSNGTLLAAQVQKDK